MAISVAIPLAPAASLDEIADIIRAHEYDENEFVSLSVQDGVNRCRFRPTPGSIPPHPPVLLPYAQMPGDPALQLLWTGEVRVGAANVRAHAYRRQAAPLPAAAAPASAGAALPPEPAVDDGG